MSRRIAAAIVRYASNARLGRHVPEEEVDALVADSMWYPEYVPVASSTPPSRRC